MSVVGHLRHNVARVGRRLRRLVDGKNRELERLRKMARFIPSTTGVLGRPLRLVDGPSFYYAYAEIWRSRCYEFHAQTSEPYIIDVGANIGLSVLYFKSLYPACRLVAFEADPGVFAVLKTNMESFGYRDVTLIGKAAWKADGILRFNSEGADGGRVLGDDSGKKVIEVQATRLRPYLEQPVDFLKMDIEGAETEVLLDCRDLLRNVRNLFVEYHSFANAPQTLHTLIALLHDAQFRVHVHSVGTSPRPFSAVSVASDMDMQLNIFAFRPAAGGIA